MSRRVLRGSSVEVSFDGEPLLYSTGFNKVLVIPRDTLLRFVEESNRIEGIHRVTETELEAHLAFLQADRVTMPALQKLVSVLQPGAVLRDRKGLDVVVGDHVPPRGGKDIPTRLRAILALANRSSEHPWTLHVAYETLHPFTDGNGRSGRALWAWQMLHDCRWPRLDLGFLHAFYYQTLERSGR